VTHDLCTFKCWSDWSRCLVGGTD